MAVDRIDKIPATVTMTTLQTRLLGVHYLLNHSRMHEAWASFGIVVRHAQALGLHRASHGLTKNHIWHEYRKRLFWAVYINDRLLSGVFGRPCAIHDDDIDQEECALVNDEDVTISTCNVTKPGAFCSASALIHYSRLLRILGEVLKRLYGPSARRSSMLQLHHLATDFEERLAQWQTGLPAYLDYVRLPPSAMSVMTQRQMCTLKLTFAYICLLLYRPFIIYTISTSTATSLRLGDWVKNCHEKSIEAAGTVVTECRYLYEHGLFNRAFWLVNYVQFAAIGTLYIYAHLWPESTHIRAMADCAMEEYPVGIEGDLVGQEYYNVLQQLRGITAHSADATENGDALSGQSVGLDQFQFDLNGAWANLFFDTTMDEQIFREML